MEKTYMDERMLLDGLFAFLDQSVSPFHGAAAACRLLEKAGYTLCPESQPWKLEAGGRYYTTRNGTAVLAWRMPRGRLAGWHVTASHGDSPTWRLKVADIAEGGYLKAETEGYGGMIASTWLDRPLSVAGRLLVRTEAGVESRLVAPDRALLCIPNLCIHFDREANAGKTWNYQVDLQPICGLEGDARLMDVLAAEAGVEAKDILAHDLVLCTRQKAERVGVSGELFMSGRIDDLECAYTTLQGFLAGRGEEEGRADVWCMFDNEEVGSSSRQGAQGTLMADVMARIEEALGVSRDESVRARANSLLLSADNGHATHPHPPENSPPRSPGRLGGGLPGRQHCGAGTGRGVKTGLRSGDFVFQLQNDALGQLFAHALGHRQGFFISGHHSQGKALRAAGGENGQGGFGAYAVDAQKKLETPQLLPGGKTEEIKRALPDVLVYIQPGVLVQLQLGGGVSGDGAGVTHPAAVHHGQAGLQNRNGAL